MCPILSYSALFCAILVGSFLFIPDFCSVSPSEIQKAIQNFKKTSPGSDQINAATLFAATDFISIPLAIFINQSLVTGSSFQNSISARDDGNHP